MVIGIYVHNLIKFIYRLITFVFVVLCFTIFRAESLSQAGVLLGSMFGMEGDGAAILSWDLQSKLAASLCFLLIAIQYMSHKKAIINVIENSNFLLRGMGLATCVMLIILSTGQSDGFIYFQF